MTRTELAHGVSEKVGIPVKDANEIVNTVFELMAGALAAKEDVTIYGFGNFKIKHKDARNCHNPSTGEAITVEAHDSIKFTPTTALKDAVK